MLTAQLDYELPATRIAQHPPAERDGARMLVVERDSFGDSWVAEWAERVPPGSLVVLNDTRVMRCRLLGQRADTGGKVELLLLQRQDDDASGEIWTAMGRASKPLRPGQRVRVGGWDLEILGHTAEGSLRVRVPGSAAHVFDASGHVPLPPYVRRPDEAEDQERYQTVFARALGSAAAPTAGLHLTPRALEVLQDRDVELARVTLHVGAGTFLPIKAEDLRDHPMHEEVFTVSSELDSQVGRARERGAQVVAVGTTVVRALESAAAPDGTLQLGEQRTRLFITPGYEFKVVDALLTNFHAPRSTLLALVAAFAGYERMRGAYAHALSGQYRFLSYGDAMWIPERFAC